MSNIYGGLLYIVIIVINKNNKRKKFIGHCYKY